jgi:hypothetical protein
VVLPCRRQRADAPADGTTFWAARRIRVPAGLTSEEAHWTLAHQLGHVLLHNVPGASLRKFLKRLAETR